MVFLNYHKFMFFFIKSFFKDFRKIVLIAIYLFTLLLAFYITYNFVSSVHGYSKFDYRYIYLSHLYFFGIIPLSIAFISRKSFWKGVFFVFILQGIFDLLLMWRMDGEDMGSFLFVIWSPIFPIIFLFIGFIIKSIFKINSNKIKIIIAIIPFIVLLLISLLMPIKYNSLTFSPCRQIISDLYERDNCYMDSALKQKNPLFCAGFSGSSILGHGYSKSKLNCFLRVFEGMGEGNLYSYEQCQKLFFGPNEFACITAIATIKNDPVACSQLKQTWKGYENSCLISLKKYYLDNFQSTK